MILNIALAIVVGLSFAAVAAYCIWYLLNY